MTVEQERERRNAAAAERANATTAEREQANADAAAQVNATTPEQERERKTAAAAERANASTPEQERANTAAAALSQAMTRLRARLRLESAPGEMPWTWSQITTLGRVVDQGSTTASALAQAEHVRRQSMAETLASLRDHGLVVTEPDPNDGRKTLISATAEGRALIQTIPAAREAWLSGAVQRLLEPDEQQVLIKAAQIMNRIADAEL
jgi:DNA-binding MarR family transcriptional regulator